MRLSLITTVLALAFTAQAATVPSSHIIHEKREVSSSKWVKREKLASSDVLPMRIGLQQRNLHRGHKFLMDVSHPNSPNYGKHWTSEEVTEMFSPDEKAVDAVRQWLIDFGIPSDRITHSDNRGWLAFDATAEDAECLLHTEYHLYESKVTGHSTPACDSVMTCPSYHVPKHIQHHVDYITPGIRLLSTMKKRQRGIASRLRGHPFTNAGPSPGFPMSAAGDLSTCDVSITPACIQALYQFPEVPEYPNNKPRSDNSMGIYEDGDYYAQEDLDLFFANFTPNIPLGTAPIPAFIDGAEAPSPNYSNYYGVNGESDMDFQLAYPIIYPQTITLFQTDDAFYSTSDIGTFNTLLDGIDGSYCTYSAFGETGDDPALDPVYPDPRKNGYDKPLQCGVYNPTNVISISYGLQEYDLPAYYQQRQCNEYMKLGLQGTSIIFASGDDGVAGPPGDANDNGCMGADATVFSPAFPNNCPYVTNVGATKVYPGKTVFEPESAANDPAFQPYTEPFSSGGGFSNLFAQPEYQAKAVASFFENHNPSYRFYEGSDSLGANSGVYNRSGRGYPDVSANGDNIATFMQGNFSLSGGTSASTPIFAAIINRLNEVRLNAGKSALGFLNPALYANASIFNDITNGTNPGCGTDGFSAVPGWDPVTGLGTPNYPKMKDYFMSLP